MSTVTLLASIGIALAPQTFNVSVDFPAAVMETARVTLQVEETHFAARSYSDAPLLIVVASEDGSSKSAFWLPAGAGYVEDFARGTLQSLQIEVLSIVDGDWSSTGSIYLADFLAQESDELLVQDCGHVLARLGENETVTVVNSSNTLMPQGLNSALKANREHRSAVINGRGGTASHFHVPVPTPTDKPKEDKPPRKRHRQLPPV
ncbi:MAG: hypothetical protein ACI9F9_002323 [Candidatus Paceibacteria bacterium]|jgi:hypothetical protein